MTKRTGPTPESIASKAIVQYLQLCRLGKIIRNNVGQVRIGQAPRHPWQRDTRRVVRFGEVGESDLAVELVNDPRMVFIEVKEPSWRAPTVPKFGCCDSTLKKYQHHVDQLAFLERQIKRGNIAFFARSPFEVWQNLHKAGFQGLPVPQETPKPISRPSVARSKP